MRKLVATSLAAFTLLAVGSASAGGGGGVPGFPKIGGNWTHVDINVTIHRAPHTLSLDRGRITQVSATQMTLRERDGSTATMPLSGQTIVQFNGRTTSLAALRRGENVMTMRIDGGPAVRVRILGF